VNKSNPTSPGQTVTFSKNELAAILSILDKHGEYGLIQHLPTPTAEKVKLIRSLIIPMLSDIGPKLLEPLQMDYSTQILSVPTGEYVSITVT
jgi:hypothetical protein